MNVNDRVKVKVRGKFRVTGTIEEIYDNGFIGVRVDPQFAEDEHDDCFWDSCTINDLQLIG